MQNTKFQLVDAFNSVIISSHYAYKYMHMNFIAKDESRTDSSPKLFFSEIDIDQELLWCTMLDLGIAFIYLSGLNLMQHSLLLLLKSASLYVLVFF